MGLNWGNGLSGAGSGAAAGSMFGPWGTAIGAGVGGLAGLFSGDSGKPYRDASKEMERYLPQAQSYHMPYLQAGQNAIPGYQNWLGGMQNPSGFINNLMGQYSESPWAKYQQDQSARSFGNAGSATGMTGSTPLLQYQQQNMHDISSQDQNQWLQNVLGVNTQYGTGLQNLMGMGQNSANALTNLLSNYMGGQTALTYGAGNAQNQTNAAGMNGLASLFSAFGQRK